LGSATIRLQVTDAQHTTYSVILLQSPKITKIIICHKDTKTLRKQCICFLRNLLEREADLVI
ncbi:MAG: hypothetical protein NTX52_10290, partial [Planctomycetota bacterium]|nr:hypothetical protein [Planctomycetota bacterium]